MLMKNCRNLRMCVLEDPETMTQIFFRKEGKNRIIRQVSYAIDEGVEEDVIKHQKLSYKNLERVLTKSDNIRDAAECLRLGLIAKKHPKVARLLKRVDKEGGVIAVRNV